MEGIIEFLISNDLRAYIIRKHFQILLVPMLNPDGVYHGFYRLDTLGQNLNRYYTICN
jgi:murein tripeptide amidase MpaA